MQPLREAIKNKYGVSDNDADKVIAALAKVEKHRQDTAGSQVQGLRARTPGTPDSAGRDVSGPNIADIIGGSGSSGSSRSTNINVTGGGLIGVLISFVIRLFMGFLSSRQQSQSSTVTNIVTDLLGGATHPGQAPDLTNIIGGLLGGQGDVDVNEIANSMLGNQPAKGRLTGPKSSQK